MLGRYILISLGIVAVLWTAYVSIDLIDKKDELSPLQLFGSEDGDLLVIHRTDEFDWNSFPFKTTLRNKELLDKIDSYPDHLKSIYISSQRSHLLLESNQLWTRRSIRKLFDNSGVAIKFDGIHSFTFKNFHGKVYRNRLYLSNKDQSTNMLTENWLVLDRKASATYIHFVPEGFELTDIYFKNGGRIDYITSRIGKVKGNQIKDKELFAHVLPTEAEEYHFYEKDFLASKDPKFAESPMYEWVDKGLVKFKAGKRTAIITDFKESQDPVNSLFDFVKKDPDNQSYGFFQNIELMAGFPNDPVSGFYVYNMDDYVVISENQDLCEEIVANYRLGNTMVKDTEKMQYVFGNLPSKVSERYCGIEGQFSYSAYKGQLFKTVLPGKESVNSSVTEEDNSFKSYKMGGEVHDFLVSSGSGTFMAITKDGYLKNYKKGTKLWEKNLNAEVLGKITKVKWRELPYTMVTTKNGVHLFDEEGNSPAGFPITVSGRQLTTQATVYTWKGRTWILAVNSNGDILQYNQGGRREALIKTGLSSVHNPIDVWVSNRKVYYGIRNDESFKMIDSDSKKEFRTFGIPANSQSIKMNNELLFFALQGDQLVKIDQKGNQQSLGGGWTDFDLTEVQTNEGKIWIVLHNSTTVKLVDESGRSWHTINTNAREIDALDINFKQGSNSLISVVDGLENDVYLYSLNGQVIGNSSFEGGSICFADEDALGARILTTVVDDFVVQHTIK